MEIHYHPDTDSLTIQFKDGLEGVVGEIMGEDLNENVVLHRDDAARYTRSKFTAMRAACST